MGFVNSVGLENTSVFHLARNHLLTLFPVDPSPANLLPFTSCLSSKHNYFILLILIQLLPHVCMHMETGVQYWVSFSMAFHLSLQGVRLNLELTDAARLGGKKPQGPSCLLGLSTGITGAHSSRRWVLGI